MSKYKDMVKNKLHPENKAPKPPKKGIRGHVRGQVSGLVHRNKSSENTTHVARPISSLTDPSSFDAPPRRRATGLAPPPPPSEEKRVVVASPSKYQDPRAAKVEPPPKVSRAPNQIEYQQQQSPQQQEEYAEEYQYQPQQQLVRAGGEEEVEAPRGPYRVNTTGLSTDHLPPPPGRRDGANKRSLPAVPSPPSYDTALSHPQQPPSKPSLPPRLPPRTNAGSASQTPTSIPSSPAPSTDNLLNQAAVSRLGNAGVSVPGLGIGSKPVASPTPPPPRHQPARGAGGHVDELQNRFSRFNTTASTASTPPSEGTSWSQKQAALKSASSFQKDPSSVSMADARSAVGVANNFRQRHGDQVASGVKEAGALNQKYGIANKVGGYAGGLQQQQQQAVSAPASPVPGLANKKKPPPPPPKKKPGLGGPSASSGGAAPTPGQRTDDAPPPIPIATRPTY